METLTSLHRTSDCSQSADERVERLARASISLSKLAPELAQIASGMAAGAQQQASQSRAISTHARRMADELERAMDGLRDSSESVHEIVRAIKRVADQTRIISINASIEAARAGQYGLAFGAVAQEVQSLAGQTTTATEQITDRMDVIRDNISRAVKAAGLKGLEGSAVPTDSASFSIRQLSTEMSEMARIAQYNAEAAQGVDGTSERIRRLSEELLLAVGSFRTPAHNRALGIFRQVLGRSEFSSLDRRLIEPSLQRAAEHLRIFELLYVSDVSGKQITANLWADGRDGSKALGADWSQRPWFTSVLESHEICVSDIYRSAATDNFCFTLSGPIFDVGGNLAGVLAADINFAELVSL